MVFKAGFLTRMLPIKTQRTHIILTHQHFDGCFVVSGFNVFHHLKNSKTTTQTKLKQGGSL